MIDISGTPAEQVGAITEFALHELEIARIKALPPGVHHGRGLVIPLTAAQRLRRMMYLSGAVNSSWLDPLVKDPAWVVRDFYYLLKDHNGGKDPTACDPADRWSSSGSDFVNRTCDCIGGMAWAGGWDRYQPTRFAHIYDGWINTDSMRMDAGGAAKCFERLVEPELGCYVVCASGSPGHRVGHIGGVVDIPADFDRKVRDCWARMKVVDVAARSPNKANAMTTAAGWFGTDAWFVKPIMEAT